MDKHQSKFIFHNYKVENIVLHWNPSYQKEGSIQMKFKLDIITSIADDKTNGTVTLKCNIFEDAEVNNYPYSLSLSIVGYFSADPTDVEEISLENGPTILYPFFRSVVADITKAANITSPLVLPLVNINSLANNTDKE
jgi:preprotein translocase subunit SecB